MAIRRHESEIVNVKGWMCCEKATVWIRERRPSAFNARGGYCLRARHAYLINRNGS
jgi:hypothetical protein